MRMGEALESEMGAYPHPEIATISDEEQHPRERNVDYKTEEAYRS